MVCLQCPTGMLLTMHAQCACVAGHHPRQVTVVLSYV